MENCINFKSLLTRDAPVVEALNAVVAKHGRWGFWKCHDRLRLDGHPWNHKRVWRVYCQMRLNLPRRTKRRLMRPAQPLDAPLWPNEIWSLDFMSDSLYQGRRFRTLNILDEGVREGLAISERLYEWLGSGLPRADSESAEVSRVAGLSHRAKRNPVVLAR